MRSVQISYLIAVRNKAPAIRRCLESLMEEDVDQIVVVDGNSTDGTSEIIDNFPVVHLYDEGKGNISAARNRGLEMCKGEYIVIIDGDQWVSTGFDRELKKIVNTGKYDAVSFRIIWTGSSTRARARQAMRLETEALKPGLNLPRAYRRSILFRVGAWDEGPLCQLEDHDLWNRVRQLNHKYLASELVIYHETSDVSGLREFNLARVTAFSLPEYVKRYPSEWRKFLSIAPIGWTIDCGISSKVFLRTRNIKIALLALALRMAGSIGWLIGLFSPGIPKEIAKKKERLSG